MATWTPSRPVYGASLNTLARRAKYGGRKGRRAARRLAMWKRVPIVISCVASPMRRAKIYDWPIGTAQGLTGYV